MLKVLIADDEIKVSKLIQCLVQWDELGMEVIGTVNDGVKAYEMILEKHPDIVITDIRMPGMDGIELVEKVLGRVGSDRKVFFVIISGYSQFEYAQQAVKLGVEDYLLKPIKKKELEAVLHKILSKYSATANALEEKENLQNRLQRTQQKIKNSFLSELVDNHRQAILKLDREEIYREFECRFPGEYFTHVVVHLFINAVAGDDEDYGFLLPKIQKMMKERMEKYCSEWMSIIHNEEVVCLFNSVENKREDFIRQLYRLKVDISNIKALFPRYKVAIGVGRTVEGLEQYQESISTAMSAIRNRFGRKDEFLLEEEGRAAWESEVSSIVSAAVKRDLLKSIELVDTESFLKSLRDLKRELSAHLQDGELLYGVYRELVTIFIMGMNSWFDSEIKTTPWELMRGYQQLYGFEEVFDWLIDHCLEIMERYEETQKNQEARPIRLAKQYINENYNKAISLENVSSHIGFNPAYFSSMFKKATGQNFMDYVIEIRILNARNLLVQTNQDVAEIAARVGYTDLKYFSRIFKKLTNLTPSEYRRLYS